MKIYISLPISSRPIEEARDHADLVKAMLSWKGHEVINPFDIPCSKSNPEWIDWICSDLPVLYKADAICLCEGWEHSTGCRIEANFAQEFKKQFMYERQPQEPSEYYFER